MKVHEHHWEGLEPDPDNFFGFIYRIDCVETGNSYIGKRQYWAAKAKAYQCKSKVADKGSPRWKESCWVEADWHYYKGSSKYLHKFMQDNPDYTFTYTIIKNCRSRGILIFSEAEYQWKYEVLTTRLPSGKHKFFNHMIAGIKFRPALEHSPATKKKMADKAIGNKNAVGSTRSLETREKMGKAKVGVPKTVEHRKKLRDINLDKHTYTFENVKTKETFTGAREEVRDSLSLNMLCIGRLIRGQQKTTGGWSLKEIHESN